MRDPALAVHYRVRRFARVQGPARGRFCVTATGMFEVDDAAWRFLAWLEDEGTCELDASSVGEAMARFGLGSESAAGLEGTDRLLVETDRRPIPFESIVLRVDDQHVSQMLSCDLSGQSIPVVLETVDSGPPMQSIVVTFQTQYCETALLAQVNDATRNLYLNSYLLGEHLHIDAPYLPHLGAPCHGCHALRLRYQLAASEARGQAGWLYYEGVLKSAGLEALPRVPLRRVQRGLVAFHLYRKVAAFLGGDAPRISSERLQERCVVDLEYGAMNHEPVTHWSHCDCVC